MNIAKRSLLLGILGLTFLGAYSTVLLSQNVTPADATSTAAAITATPIYVATIDPTVFASATQVSYWIEHPDPQREHGWALWADLTKNSGQVFNGTELPVWDTWYTPMDVFQTGPGAARNSGVPHEFNSFNQLTGIHTEASTDNSQKDLVGFNKFNPAYANFIWDNDYNKYETLYDLQQDCINSQKVPCAIKEFPPTAIALKPVFQPVAQDAVTIIPVWDGIVPGVTTTWTINSEDGLPPGTWLQCIAIDLRSESKALPVGYVINNFSGEWYDENGKVSDKGTQNLSCHSATVVSIEDFYHINLTDEEVKGVQQNQITVQPNVLNISTMMVEDQTLQAGDSAVLVAMHITTKEIANWVWMTVWWSPHPDEGFQLPIHYPTTQDVIKNGAMYSNYPGGGADRPDSIQAPWNHYVMCTNYQYTFPQMPDKNHQADSLIPAYCFNPYLEAGFKQTDVPPMGGINTNCMACHGNANWSVVPEVIPPGYTSARYIPRDDSSFKGVVQTDFAWSISGNVTPSPMPSPVAPTATSQPQ